MVYNSSMDIKEIVTMCSSLLLALLSCALGFIVRKLKIKYVATSNIITPYIQKILDLCTEAEAHGNYSADEKLEYVTSRMLVYCTMNKLPFEEVNIKNDVNVIIDFSNKVNVKKLNVLN